MAADSDRDMDVCLSSASKLRCVMRLHKTNTVHSTLKTSFEVRKTWNAQNDDGDDACEDD